MAQLSDDCFAFGGALLGVDAALALIAARIVPVVEEESIPLAQAAFFIALRRPDSKAASGDATPMLARRGTGCR